MRLTLSSQVICKASMYLDAYELHLLLVTQILGTLLLLRK